MKNVKWGSVFLIAGAMGFASGISSSGAAQIIADFAIRICGPIGESPFGMWVICLCVTALLSNFISNTAAALTLSPIAISFAQSFGADILPFVLVCAIGASLSVATPVCNANLSLISSIGYKFKDIFRVGGIINILAVITAACFPAALALLEQNGGSGKDLITCITLGDDFLEHFGWTTPDINVYGWLGPMIKGIFVSALAGGKALQFDEDTMRNCLGFALEQACGSSQCLIEVGNDVKEIYQVFAQRAGVFACELARRGVNSPKKQYGWPIRLFQ